MKVFFYSIAALLLLSACRGGKVSDPEAALPDSVVVEADEAAHDAEPTPPEAADGLFDDFIYSFMRSRNFQVERTDFPLPNRIDGKDLPIARKDWKFDPLYVKQDVYTLLFDNPRSVKAEKDTSLKHVVVEWVYLDKKRVKQYHFNKRQGRWRLTALETQDLGRHANSDFYEFYRRFSSQPDFQRAHIANPFRFKTYDSDNFQDIEGLLDVSQWPDYRPNLPEGVITNINYGQSYGDARQRVLMICSPSGGMGCSMTFVRKGDTWMLQYLEN